MVLKDYFEQVSGVGVLSTADAKGRANSAIYASPIFFEDETVAFVMAHRKSYSNIQQKPYASYLFIEDGPGYKGKRLSLTKVKETDDPERIESLRRRNYSPEKEKAMSPLHLVYFHVDDVRPLIRVEKGG